PMTFLRSSARRAADSKLLSICSAFSAVPICSDMLLGGLLILLLSLTGFSARGAVWDTIEPRQTEVPKRGPWMRKFSDARLNRDALNATLRGTPNEFTPAAGQGPPITLPMPDGTTARFQIWESPIMAPELAAKYPELKTYAGRGIDDPAATLRMDLSPAGLH